MAFRRWPEPKPKRARWPTAIAAIVVAVTSFVAVYLLLPYGPKLFPERDVAPPVVSLGGKSGPVVIYGPGTTSSTNPTSPTGPISVIDGDTVRSGGQIYRLVGFDTPEKGDLARCDDERRRAEAATVRLRALVVGKDVNLQRVPCACRPGEEGTTRCNYGRLCGSLTVNGRDVGQILIAEGLARAYVCSGTRCPPRRPWCDSQRPIK